MCVCTLTFMPTSPDNDVTVISVYTDLELRSMALTRRPTCVVHAIMKPASSTDCSSSCDGLSFYSDIRQVAAPAAGGIEWSQGSATLQLSPPLRMDQQSRSFMECSTTSSWPSPPAAPALMQPNWNRLLPATPSPAALDTFDSENDDLESWQQRYPKQWTNVDVLNFIYTLPRRFNDITLATLRGENFQGITGPDLYRMSRDDFVFRDPQHGQLLYACVKKHLDDTETKCSRSTSFSGSEQRPIESPVRRPQLPKPVEDLMETDACAEETVNNIDSSEFKYKINGQEYDYDPDLDALELPQPEGGVATFTHRTLACIDALSASQDECLPSAMIDDSSRSYTDLSTVARVQCPNSGSSIDSLNIPLSVCDPLPGFSHSANYDRRTLSETDRSSPSVSSIPTNGAVVKKRRYTRRMSCPETTGAKNRGNGDQKSNGSTNKRTEPGKGGHLWEFIMRLLKSSEMDTDRIIQWEDRNEGVFRIVNSKAVARLWGEQKDNRKTKMTYEKLSRALRWCRSDGFLSKVPKDGRYPKKLCFCFGPKAVNWRDDLL